MFPPVVFTFPTVASRKEEVDGADGVDGIEGVDVAAAIAVGKRW